MLDRLDSLDRQDFLVVPDPKVLLDVLVQLEQLDLKAMQVRQGLRDRKVALVNRDHLVRLEILDLRDRLELLVSLETPDSRVQLVTLASQALQDSKEIVDRPVHLDLQAQWDQQDNLDWLELPALSDLLDSLDSLEQQDPSDCKVILVTLVRLETLDNQAVLGLREQQACLVQVDQRAKLVLRDQRE
jgi:regulator of replication initiation timing